MGLKLSGIVALCSYVEWRRYGQKEGLYPLFKPLQHRRITPTVTAAYSCVSIPREIKLLHVFAEQAMSISPILTTSASPNIIVSPLTLPPPPATSKYSVLIVEDNVLNAKMLTNMLKNDYIIETAANGELAIAAVQAHPPDLILMDIQMPVMDGIAATQELRRLGYQMPIIAATASYSISERELSYNAGMTDVIAKPFTKQGVLAIVRRHIFTSSPRSAGEKGTTPSVN